MIERFSNANARMTLNEAEYLSLIDALQVCLQKGVQCMVVKGGLLLIIRQVQGMREVQKDSLRPLPQ